MERRRRSVRRRIDTSRVHVRRTTWEVGSRWVNWLEMSIMIKSIKPAVDTHSEWKIEPRHYNYRVPKTLTLVVRIFVWTRSWKFKRFFKTRVFRLLFFSWWLRVQEFTRVFRRVSFFGFWLVHICTFWRLSILYPEKYKVINNSIDILERKEIFRTAFWINK
jgi:hypothetical protein